MKNRLILILLMAFNLVVQAREQYILTSDNVSIYVNIKGRCTPCLYIHGGPGSGSYWVEKFFGNMLEQHFK